VPEISDREADSPQWGSGGFGWSQRRVEGGVVVHVAGELDFAASAELGQRLLNLVELDGAAVVVLDLSELRFIDAHCVGVIMAAWEAARCRGRRLEIDGLRGIPARVFDVLGLRTLLAAGMCEDTAGEDAHG
jgi:anti-anti-sigma factor